jgi:hypothetical protein
MTNPLHAFSMERDTADSTVLDRFERGSFVESLIDLLFDRSEHKARGFVAGLTGPWGSGKSQVMLYVEAKLREMCFTPVSPAGKESLNLERRVIVVRFNPWLYSGRDNLLRQFFQCIREEVNRLADPALRGVLSNKDRAKAMVHKYSSVLKAIPHVGTAAAEAASTAFAEKPLEAQKNEFVNSLEESGASVIALIDEIDRLSDEEIREIAQTVKSVADFPMFSYLLAYDPDRVAKALGRDDPRLGYQYLEKIVQVQARLPRVDPNKLVAEIGRQLLPLVSGPSGSGGSPTAARPADWMEAISHLVPDIISTPRDARRLTAALALRFPLLRDEVNPFDLLRFCALEARVPILSERIQHLTACITVDGSRELRRRAEQLPPASESITAILGGYEQEKPLRDLLIYLFPALREGGSEEITRDEDRLCYETPLQSLLNYAPVAGAVSRKQARDALENPQPALAGLLSTARDAGRLRHAVLRLRRLCRDTALAAASPPLPIVAIWRQFGEFFDREMTEADIVKWDSWLDLTHVFVRGALRNYTSHGFLTCGFVESLLASGQIHLPARILMFHIQAHGLCGTPRDSLLTPALTKDDTINLLPLASDHIARKLLAGSPRWFLRSAIPLWIIRAGDQGDRWSTVLARLNHPSSPAELDGTLILAMRYSNEEFMGETLPKLLDLQEIARKGRALQNPEPELRTPTEVAYQFLRSQFRAPAPH